MVKLDSPNYDQEEKILLQHSGLSDTVGRPGQRNKSQGNRTEFDVFKYFSSVRCDEIESLEKIYHLDFLLFQYDHKDYLIDCLS